MCKEHFEFVSVEEFELAFCPFCGTDFMTGRNGQKQLLEYVELDPRETNFQRDRILSNQSQTMR